MKSIPRFSIPQLLILLLLTHFLCGLIWLKPALAFPFTPQSPSPSLVHDVLFKGTDISKMRTDPSLSSVVHLYFERSDEYTGKCLGILIAPDLVLTAAHCLLNLESITVEVTKRRSPLQYEMIPGKDWVHHENYNRNGLKGGVETHVDLGLIALERPVNPNIPIALFAPPNLDFENLPLKKDRRLDAKILFLGRGWGGESAKKKVHFARLDNIEAIRPNELYRSKLKGGSGSCHGDSGGPVLIGLAYQNDIKNELYFLAGVGLGSNDPIPAETLNKAIRNPKDFPSQPECGESVVYTVIAPYIPWIEQKGQALLGHPVTLRF